MNKFSSLIKKHAAALLKVTLCAIAIIDIALPAIATPQLWQWQDRSALLPTQDGWSTSHISYAKNAWLISNGRGGLYRFDGATLSDLSSTAKARGIYNITNIFSDGSSWLITAQSPTSDQPSVWITDGASWIDVSASFSYANGGIDAVGYQGTWYVRTYQKSGNPGVPNTWKLYRYQAGADTKPVAMELPANYVAQTSGCATDLAGSQICNGWNGLQRIDGAWYLFGGRNQSRGTDGRTLQEARAQVWRLEGTTWKEISTPNVKFISNTWSNGTDALVATTDITSSPFNTDRFWVFTGAEFREVSQEAYAVGFLSKDAREMHASWNGRAWVILAGKTIARFDGRTMEAQTPTRDLFYDQASNNGGLTVFIGAESRSDLMVPTAPMRFKLVTMTEDLNQEPPRVNRTGSEIVSKILGPALTTTSNPADFRVGNGKTFSFRAQSSSDDLERIDIYANGGRVRSCFDSDCLYAQTYWTNGADTRRVELYARAINSRGYATESAHVTLIVDIRSNASASIESIPVTNAPQPIPERLAWRMETDSMITHATWMTPDTTILDTKTVTWSAAGRAANGLSSIEIWVNGSPRERCSFDGRVTDTRSCSVTFDPKLIPGGSEVFVNAKVIDSRGAIVWTTSNTLTRPRTQVSSTPSTPAPSAPVNGPVFYAKAELSPVVATVARGEKVTYKVRAMDNTKGLSRIEITVNGTVARACAPSGSVSEVTCEHIVDTSSFTPGTSVLILAKAINATGQERVADGKSILIRDGATSNASQEAPNVSGTLSTWSWTNPTQETITDTETLGYTVGAWSASGIESMELIANGRTRSRCDFDGATAKGTKECTMTLRTQDFSDGETVVFNARITAVDGAISWTDVRTVRIRRTWNSTLGAASYVQVSHDRPNGYVYNDQVTLRVRGWSQDGVQNMQLYVNGFKVLDCPSDTCVYTTPLFTNPTLEYQARMTDRLGRVSWSGVYGLHIK